MARTVHAEVHVALDLVLLLVRLVVVGGGFGRFVRSPLLLALGMLGRGRVFGLLPRKVVLDQLVQDIKVFFLQLAIVLHVLGEKLAFRQFLG